MTRPGVFPAGRATPCNVCGQQIQPGDPILRISGRLMLPIKGEGLTYMPGSYAHEDCVWHGSPAAAPYLSWEQMDAIMAIVTTLQLPKGESRTRKLLGAVTMARFNKYHAPNHQPSEPALSLGEDLLAGYRFILEAADHSGPWYEPVGYDGQPWVAPRLYVVPERTEAQPEETTKERRVQSQSVHPMAKVLEEKGLLESGFWVRGSLITPVLFCLLTPINVHIRPVDQPGNWAIVPNYQLAGSMEEAEADVANWMAKIANH